MYVSKERNSHGSGGRGSLDSRFGTLDREVVKMKYDELRPYTIYEGDVGNYTEHVVYSKSEADAVIAENEAENRKLQRALWIARANRAIEKIAWFKLWNASISTMNLEDGARQEFDKWKKNLGKFLKKAEEYK